MWWSWRANILNKSIVYLVPCINHRRRAYLSVDMLGVFENSNNIPNDCDTQVHHDVLTEIHQHALLNSVHTQTHTWNEWELSKGPLHCSECCVNDPTLLIARLIFNKQRQYHFIQFHIQAFEVWCVSLSWQGFFLPVVYKAHSVGGSHTRRDSCISEKLDPLRCGWGQKAGELKN